MNKPTHRKHNQWHDYKSRSIYHITIVVSDRQPVLGKIIKIGPTARCELTPLGVQVSQCLVKIEALGKQHGRQLQLLAKVVMPDHIHFVLFVKQPMDVPLGTIIHGFKLGCNKALRQLIEQQAQGSHPNNSCPANSCLDKATENNEEERQSNPAVAAPALSTATATPALSTAVALSSSPSAVSGLPSHESNLTVPQYQRPQSCWLPNVKITSQRMLQEHALFEPDFDETILKQKHQLRHMIDYVHNNPEHRWQRSQKPGWLLPIRNIVINNRSYDAIGNVNLLGLSRKQVWIRSAWDEATRRNYMNQCIVEARKNKVLISPYISEHEKQVRDVALHEGHSIVQLVSNGFGDLEQCPGNLYAYCCQGQVLLIVPSEYPRIEKPGRISRQQCVVLNALAGEVCKDLCLD